MDLPALKPDSNNLLDIIVPAYNNPDITARCLAALLLFKPPGSRIIYVNNGSEDRAMADLAGMVQASGGLYHEIAVNRGPYVAVNEALGLGDSMLVGVVCNDVVVLPNTLAALVSSLRPELAVPVVGAAEAPGVDGWSFDATVRAAQAAGLGKPEMVAQQGFFSCFLGFRSVFHPDSVGPFDEDYFVTFGDADWEERYRDAGLIYGKAHHAVVYHGRSTTRKRLGVDVDVQNDRADHDTFKKKWANRPDVLARHGGDPPDAVRRLGTLQAWAGGEQ